MNKSHQPSIENANPAMFFAGHSIDCVIIGLNEKGINILVLKWREKDFWMLPGGFILEKEDMRTAATRILQERTSLELGFLQQFFTFGDFNRRNIDEFLKRPEVADIKDWPMFQFMKQRFVTTGYLALVEMDKCTLNPDPLSETCMWFPLDELPNLIFDHREIVNKAIEQIRKEINYLPIGISLLPEEFTMKQLQHLYESVLNIKFDRANFQKKILKLKLLDRLGKQKLGERHKAPYLYKFNINRYEELIKQGIGFIS